MRTDTTPTDVQTTSQVGGTPGREPVVVSEIGTAAPTPSLVWRSLGKDMSLLTATGTLSTPASSIMKTLPSPSTTALSVPSASATPAVSATIATNAGVSPRATFLPLAPVTPRATATTTPRLYWPDFVPEGMSLAVEDSWPFRAVAPDRQDEPFLIFRGGPRWLLIRNHNGQDQVIPRSATVETLLVGNTPARLINYLGGGFKLILPYDGGMVQISGQNVADADVRQTAVSLRLLDEATLRARLIQEAARQKPHVTLLWPSYLPDGMQLVPAETIAQIALPRADPQADGYRVSFKGGSALFQIGGGTVLPPSFPGRTERIVEGDLTGVLTSVEQRHLLVMDGVGGAAHPIPIFPRRLPGRPARLPLVQKGRIFISGENIGRQQFERVVAGLIVLRSEEFIARARGQNAHNLVYRWPSTLPNGLAVDLGTVRVAWDDFLLQGGAPFFQLNAVGPDGTVVIRGGRESSGAAFVVPEGSDVKRTIASIRGRTVSAASTPEGVFILWTEDGSHYAINATSLPVEQLVRIGEGLQRLSVDEFFRRIR